MRLYGHKAKQAVWIIEQMLNKPIDRRMDWASYTNWRALAHIKDVDDLSVLHSAGNAITTNLNSLDRE